MLTDVTVAIPWRPAPDRIDAYRRVTSFWTHHGIPIVTADSQPAALPFSLSEARNRAVKKVRTAKVIVTDADTIPDIGAIQAALANDGVTWPFTLYRHIPGEYATKADLMSAPVDAEYRGSVAGILVCDVATYWAVGGMDERFDRRWGFEDNAFHTAVVTLSRAHRTPGIVFSFNHAADRDTSPDNPNRHRAALYALASTSPELMRELVKR